MKELSMFGCPVGFEENDSKLIALDESVSYEDTSRKYSGAMFGLLADDTYKVEDDPYYDFYKAICHKDDSKKFSDRELRFDSTVILPGSAGDEYKKTAGHFHCKVPGSELSYPELYQVIKGTALFVMQKVDDEQKTDGKMVVEDCILAEVCAGETIVIPPCYGHCTVNISDESMVFINLVSVNSINAYDSVKNSHGMCSYILKTSGGGYRVEKNSHYEFRCEPKIVTTIGNERLGIKKDLPAYTAYLGNPRGFDYLKAPADYMDDFFAVLKAKS